MPKGGYFSLQRNEEAKEEEKRPCYIGYGTKQQMAELTHWASHDDADCRIFSATNGLVAPDTDLEDQSGISTTAAALASTIAQQLKTLNCSKLVLYSTAMEKRPSVHTVLGCLHLAAAQIGGLKVVHEEVEDWGKE